ncbi:hypothetical protein MAPG_08250 [Magnaporthiopsis poae ATCC 64411]|uniref:Transcription factor domain-containing protein n=1 Tax=Magnaporthiopsis poae (strain ATCC 64411 / 73-15) TaxID=644358 RepID=A0A0C4E6V3_MAGP6|nr:hypothetical protein MAPG_08250 [Magnaporthiopsis poae ATCC 64411]
MQHTGFPASAYGSLPPTSTINPALLTRSEGLSTNPAAGLPGSDDGGPNTIAAAPYPYTSSVHHMLRWPVVQSLLESVSSKIPNVNVSSIRTEEVAAALGLNNSENRIPIEDAGAITFVDHTPGMPAAASPQSSGSPLTSQSMENLANAFFSTFWMRYPIVDQQPFMTEILGPITRDGFTDSIQSTLALLVLALGEMAILGTQGAPVSTPSSPQPSGVKGGTPSHPPGLALYNEARRRMGFYFAECSLEAVQVFSLAGLFESHALPQSNLESLEDLVGPPVLTSSHIPEGFSVPGWSLPQDYFASATALRRLSMEAHKTLGRTLDQYISGVDPEALGRILEELARNLEQWKSLLPPHLRWAESRPEEFPIVDGELYHEMPEDFPMTAAPPFVVGTPSRDMFTSDLAAQPTMYEFNVDVRVAALRSRYYYAKFNIYRQYVFRVLNHPDQISPRDAKGVAECLKACLKWPVSMSPTSRNKRLVPCLFFWTQNMLGMLVLLHLSQSVQVLSTIRHTLCGEDFEGEARETVALYIEWIRDLKTVDSAARWAWEIVRAIYNLEE